MSATPKKKRALPVAIGIALTALVAFGAPRIPFIHQIELLSFDARLRLAPAPPASPSILHLDMDAASVKYLGRWPWDRHVHARFLDMMTLLGAEQVVFDVEFQEAQKPFMPESAADLVEEVTRIHANRYKETLQKMSREKDAAELFGTFARKEEEFADEVKETVRGQIHDYDEVFVNAILRHGNILIGVTAVPSGPPPDTEVTDETWKTRATLGPAGPGAKHAEHFVPPIEVIGKAAIGFGTVTIEPDPDGVTRRVVLLWNHEGKLYPQLGFRAALDALGIPFSSVRVEGGFVRAGDISIPLDSQGCMPLLWRAGPPGKLWEGMFQHVTYADLSQAWDFSAKLDKKLADIEAVWPRKTAFTVRKKLSDAFQEALRKAGQAPRTGRSDALWAMLDQQRQEEDRLIPLLQEKTAEVTRKGPSDTERKWLDEVLPLIDDAREIHRWLREKEAELRGKILGKVCFVGACYHSSIDYHVTPLRPSEKIPGVSVHSNVFNMVLNRKFLTFAPGWVAMALALGFGALTTLLGMRLNALAGGLVAGGGVAAYAFLCLFFFTRGTLFPFVVPSLGAALPFVAVAIIRAFTEEKQKREIRKLFEHYVDPTLVDQLVEDPSLVGLAGREREGSVLFADVAGFTNFSYATPAEEAVEFVNHYLSIGTRFILNHKGYLDKYMGDGIMAIFGAPLPLPDHAAQACLVALELQNNIVGDELGKLFLQRAGKPFVIRVGITAGRFVAGNIGSDRVSYTAIGDNVNLAARLQSAGKELDSHMLCNEEAALAAQSAVETRPMGLFTVRGREAIVKVHEILCVKGALTPEQKEFLKWYEEGLAAYLDRKWDAAIESLRKADTLKPRDKATSIYIKRSETYRASPPEKIEAIPL